LPKCFALREEEHEAKLLQLAEDQKLLAQPVSTESSGKVDRWGCESKYCLYWWCCNRSERWCPCSGSSVVCMEIQRLARRSIRRAVKGCKASTQGTAPVHQSRLTSRRVTLVIESKFVAVLATNTTLLSIVLYFRSEDRRIEVMRAQSSAAIGYRKVVECNFFQNRLRSCCSSKLCSRNLDSV
jgi:hypothetical protein